MENLDKSQFIVLLETSLNRRLLSPEQKTLDAAYEDYIDLLHGLTVQSCKSSLDLLHELARLQSCLMRLQERIVEKESPQVLLLKSALLLTNFEIRLVFTRVRYPSIAAPVSVEVPKSPLFLSELMILKQVITDRNWWLVAGLLLLMCIVIYSFGSRLIRLCYQPNQDRLHPSKAHKALSWSALSLLAAAIVLGMWQPELLQRIITEIAAL